ncbi:RNA polymerase sigma-70 factor (ECF subfamily) [Georgenia soli]|uniref:RNA polymerase sigma-70 factor (ECF subfamily) n=1 Tax=Georgenia soli TaxID=638953 RepID=A0A2A9EN21_9MICO|nr:RNA polymerase sigma factor [Georgenia soli]PFG39931.1 RNA polymerase sigma-70 factor (ECF subfamily) [Georgenia soli]
MSDEELFDRLYEAHLPDLRAFIYRRIPPAQVDDVVAETFLVAWRRIAEVPAEPRPWLFGIARRVMLTTRTQGRWLALQVRLAAEPPGRPQELAGDVAARLDLTRAWSRLTAGEREVLSLIAWDGLTVAEAATVLGCQPGTFRMRLMRARRHLLHILDRLPAVEAWPLHPVTEGVRP